MWASVGSLAVVIANGWDGHDADKKSKKGELIRWGNVFPICHSWDKLCKGITI